MENQENKKSKRKSNITIRTKLISGFLTIIGFLIIIGTLGIRNAGDMTENANTMYQVNLQNVDQLHILKEKSMSLEILNMHLTNDASAALVGRVSEEILRVLNETNEVMAEVGSRLVTEEGKRIWQDIQPI